MPSDPGTWRSQLVAAARSYLGVRFRHQGRSRAVGLDCAGLVLVPAWDAGLTDYDFRAYARYPDGKTLKRLFEACVVPVGPDNARPGDIVLLRDIDGAWPCHMGYLTGTDPSWTMIHCYGTLSVRRVVEHAMGESWRRKVVGIYSWPQLAGGK